MQLGRAGKGSGVNTTVMDGRGGRKELAGNCRLYPKAAPTPVTSDLKAQVQPPEVPQTGSLAEHSHETTRSSALYDLYRYHQPVSTSFP